MGIEQNFCNTTLQNKQAQGEKQKKGFRVYMRKQPRGAPVALFVFNSLSGSLSPSAASKRVTSFVQPQFFLRYSLHWEFEQLLNLRQRCAVIVQNSPKSGDLYSSLDKYIIFQALTESIKVDV